jgi:hypothetical protein
MSEDQATTIYRQNAESLWLSGSDAVFSNGQAEHAAILYQTFLKHGKHELLMFVRNLSKDVFGSREMEALTLQALSRKMHIDVICQSAPESTKIAENIRNWKTQKLPISLHVCSENEPAAKYPQNFAVVDGKAYRFEADRNSPKAVACMNDPKAAQTLREVFFRLKSGVQV